MKTIIGVFDESDNPIDLIISDEGFDLPGWISLKIGETVIETTVDDFMPALIAFEAKQVRHDEKTNNLIK